MDCRLLCLIVFVNLVFTSAMDLSFLSEKLPSLIQSTKYESQRPSLVGNGALFKKILSSLVLRDQPMSPVLLRGQPLSAAPLSALLLRGQPLTQNEQEFGGFNQRALSPFNWSSCGPQNQAIDIKNLSITPAPLSLPGPIAFAFDIVFHYNVGENEKISAQLELDVKAGSQYIKIPCIGQIGSCSYDDLCSLLNGVTCPSVFDQEGVPCKCPFHKGEYKLTKYKVTVLAAVFIPGSYRAKATLNSAGRQLGCYQIDFTIQ